MAGGCALCGERPVYYGCGVWLCEQHWRRWLNSRRPLGVWVSDARRGTSDESLMAPARVPSAV